MSTPNLEYIAAGGNRHPSAADWHDKALAFGSGNNIAVWDPQSHDRRGVTSLLSGHTDVVNAVKLFQDTTSSSRRQILISGSADKTVRVWLGTTNPESFVEKKCLTEHTASVNAIAVLPESGLFVTGAADATVKIWRLKVTETDVEVSLVQDISLTPRFFPLAVAITSLSDGQIVFAVAGTTASIRIFVQHGEMFKLGATLTGHEGWIRSLDFVKESSAADSDRLLASASQDKYIRLWRFHKGSELPASASAAQDPTLGAFGKSLSNKAHYIGEENSKHSITFEALLIGHEDWIYTAKWYTNPQTTTTTTSSGPRLLTASADNSLAIWEQDADSSIWACTARLGEISAQKGSTTATGSTGGFWIGLWSADGSTVTSLGRTGSWRIWGYNSPSDRWLQAVGISGHVREVKDVAWARDGSYLLSTSSDQTTRLHAEWKHEDAGTKTWHEMARPQIHGYDLNCLDSISPTQFISGADEKLLRVFNTPKAVAALLARLSGTADLSIGVADLPEAANIPVLGLSNKAITGTDADDNGVPDDETEEAAAAAPAKAAPLDIAHPPFEDHLARQTLFPEHEKLYGHGYEISAVAASPDGLLLATACRASSLEHAVIRLYDTRTWHEIRPSLQAHSLTVTNLAWEAEGKWLLSTGRDRQFALFRFLSPKSGEGEAAVGEWKRVGGELKGHSRMILSAAWAPPSSSQAPVFATAGRDKCVKVWRILDAAATAGEEVRVELIATITTAAPATALAFLHETVDGKVVLAYGIETGVVAVVGFDVSGGEVKVAETAHIPTTLLPSGAINALSWRPARTSLAEGSPQTERQLAVASEDHSVRLLTFSDDLL